MARKASARTLHEASKKATHNGRKSGKLELRSKAVGRFATQSASDSTSILRVGTKASSSAMWMAANYPSCQRRVPMWSRRKFARSYSYFGDPIKCDHGDQNGAALKEETFLRRKRMQRLLFARQKDKMPHIGILHTNRRRV